MHNWASISHNAIINCHPAETSYKKRRAVTLQYLCVFYCLVRNDRISHFNMKTKIY